MISRLILFLFCFFSLSFIGLSQIETPVPSLEDRKKEYETGTKKPKTLEQKAENTAKKITEQLGLKPEQTKEVYSAILSAEQEIARINKSKMTVREKSLSINNANKARYAAFEKIMTPKQFKNYRMSFP